MGQRQNHRGKHPEDARLFAPKWAPILQRATTDLSHLLTRDYAQKSAITLVGDHYQLTVRQRIAVERAACPDQSLARRRAHEVPLKAVAGHKISVDGYNVLIGAESALAGGILVRGRDGCIRDMAGIHGSYHTVAETLPAVHLLGNLLERLDAGETIWYLDSPVSNSGRLRALLADEAEKAGWPWRVILHNNPDKELADSADVVISGDSWILDRARAWTNLMGEIVAARSATVNVLDLSLPE